GINLTAQSFPPELQARATSVAAETGRQPDRAAVLAALVSHLARRYEQLHERGGPAETIRAWCAASSYAAGKRVRVETSAETFTGTTRGLEPDGALRVETDARELHVVRAGDVHAVRQLDE